MRISDWSSDVCSSDLPYPSSVRPELVEGPFFLLKGEKDGASTSSARMDYRSIPNSPMIKVASYNMRKGIGLDRRRDPGRVLSVRSEEHTFELQSLMRISYAVLCLTKTIQKKRLLLY